MVFSMIVIKKSVLTIFIMTFVLIKPLFSVKKDGKTGKIYAVYVPWGPTGVGEQTIMPCEEGVK